MSDINISGSQFHDCQVNFDEAKPPSYSKQFLQQPNLRFIKVSDYLAGRAPRSRIMLFNMDMHYPHPYPHLLRAMPKEPGITDESHEASVVMAIQHLIKAGVVKIANVDQNPDLAAQEQAAEEAAKAAQATKVAADQPSSAALTPEPPASNNNDRLIKAVLDPHLNLHFSATLADLCELMRAIFPSR